MTTRSQRIRAGVFAVIGLALGALVLIVFGGLRFWKKEDHYQIVVDGSVMGLDEGALVYLAGIKVGTVESIDVSPTDLRQVVVSIAVDHGTPIRKDTEARLDYAGITGLKVIDLQGGTYASAPLPEGGTIEATEGTIQKLQKKAELLVDQSALIMYKANQIVDNVAAITKPERFTHALDEADAAAGDLAATAKEMRAMVGEDRVLVTQSLAAVRDTAASAQRLADGGNEVVGQIHTFITANQGRLRTAIYDLEQASRSFKELAREVRQRPSQLLFSSAPPDRKTP